MRQNRPEQYVGADATVMAPFFNDTFRRSIFSPWSTQIEEPSNCRLPVLRISSPKRWESRHRFFLYRDIPNHVKAKTYHCPYCGHTLTFEILWRPAVNRKISLICQACSDFVTELLRLCCTVEQQACSRENRPRYIRMVKLEAPFARPDARWRTGLNTQIAVIWDSAN